MTINVTEGPKKGKSGPKGKPKPKTGSTSNNVAKRNLLEAAARNEVASCYIR